MVTTTRRAVLAGLIVIACLSTPAAYAQSAYSPEVTEQPAQPSAAALNATEPRYPEATSQSPPATSGTTSSSTSQPTDEVEEIESDEVDEVDTDEADEVDTDEVDEVDTDEVDEVDTDEVDETESGAAGEEAAPTQDQQGQQTAPVEQSNSGPEGTTPPPASEDDSTERKTEQGGAAPAPAPVPTPAPDQQAGTPADTVEINPGTPPADTPGIDGIDEEAGSPNGRRHEADAVDRNKKPVTDAPEPRCAACPFHGDHQLTPDGAVGAESLEALGDRSTHRSQPAESRPGEAKRQRPAGDLGEKEQEPVAGASLGAPVSASEDRDAWSAAAGLLLLALALVAVRAGRRVEPQ